MNRITFGLLICTATILLSCSRNTPVRAENDPTNSAVAPESKVDSRLLKVLGKWQRPDGGYVISIEKVGRDGQLAARYFNPNPINVSKSVAMVAGSEVKVFVELNDVNYPGSTYSLALDPVHDQLYGEYYQAGIQQRFDVTFSRLKE